MSSGVSLAVTLVTGPQPSGSGFQLQYSLACMYLITLVCHIPSNLLRSNAISYTDSL